MKQLRLMADDLTGALDSAAQFVTPARAIPAYLNGGPAASVEGDLAVDCATRELDGARSARLAARHAPMLAPGPGVIAFKKVDSLLRGHPGIELVAVLNAVPVRRCIVAPAFPFHGRVTRGGLQFARHVGSWRRVGEDLRSMLESHGVSVRLRRPGEPVPEGVSLWDAETDEDLRQIARAAEELPETVLWCGSAGLAAALANTRAPVWGGLERPVLGLFGSDHPATAAQLAACAGLVLRMQGGGVAGAAAVASRLKGGGVCLVAFDIPAGTARSAAAGRIARGISELTRRVRAPGSLIVAGGQTLRELCLSLETEHLRVVGQAAPGVPLSVMVGGRWNGVRVVSKSGAFGGDMLLRQILAPDNS
jgi:uncharacterized protein YgbK (DUF1537 family)